MWVCAGGCVWGAWDNVDNRSPQMLGEPGQEFEKGNWEEPFTAPTLHCPAI